MPRPVGQDYDLKSLLDQRNIRIPEYQRTYDWSKTTVEQLLECLKEHQKMYTGNLQTNPYFLGNLMIHTDVPEDAWYLVDGQQRMVTLTILAGLVRDLLCEYGGYSEAFELQEQIIGDLAARDSYLIPRETNTESSPRQLLWPIQAPKDQSMSFSFLNEYTESQEMSAYDLSEPLTLKFPLEQDSIYEINLGVKIRLKAPYNAGLEITNIYGDLILDEGATISADDTHKFESNWRSQVINNMRVTWSGNYRLVQHFKKNMRNYLQEEINQFDPHAPLPLLRDWKDIITYMSFTTTTFIDDSDAIYYFGKLNDAETSQQLNVGDLMRHHAAYVVKRPDIGHPRNEDIISSWNVVENELKEERSKDMVPAFLSSWLTSHGDRRTERKAYNVLKEYSKDQFELGGGHWDKEGFYSWINQISNGSSLFREIVFPEAGDPNKHAMKCIEGLAKQHRPLFLAGLLAFQKNNMDDEMQRLIKIFEFLTMKGVEFPTLVGASGITSQDRYALIDKYCSKLHQATRNYENVISPVTANTILDEFAGEVKRKCTAIWVGAAADESLEIPEGWAVESLFERDIRQSLAKMILSRIEIEKSAGAKTWNIAVEVEHVAPQTWQDEWSEEDKGGGFENGDQCSQYVNKLGNRTLLNPGSNASLGNKSLIDKQNADEFGYNVQAESWIVTRSLKSDVIQVWNPEQIEIRSRRLFEDLLEIYSDEFLE